VGAAPVLRRRRGFLGLLKASPICFAHVGNAPSRKSDALCLVGKLWLPALVGVLPGSHQAAGEAHTPLARWNACGHSDQYFFAWPAGSGNSRRGCKRTFNLAGTPDQTTVAGYELLSLEARQRDCRLSPDQCLVAGHSRPCPCLCEPRPNRATWRTTVGGGSCSAASAVGSWV